jgi:hypothetical protein
MDEVERMIFRVMSWLVLLSCLRASLASGADTDGTVGLEVSTSSTGGKFSPRHVLAVWVTDANTNFVKTLCRYGTKRQKYLKAWRQARADSATVDGVTGATRKEHTPLNVTWDCRDAEHKPLADGTYLLFVEFADSHDASPKAVFPVVKGPKPHERTFPDEKFFTRIRVIYKPESK